LVYTNSLSDHCLIAINRKANCIRYPSKNIKVRDYSKYNREDLKNEIRNLPWENCLFITDFNQAWNVFKIYLVTAINKHAPLKEKTVRGKSNPWLTREIRNSINTHDYHLRRFKRTNSAEDWESYKQHRNSVTSKIRNAKANHVRNALKESSGNPSDFWKQIKTCYPTKESYSPSKSFVINGTVTSNVRSIANAFCSFFTKVGSNLMKSTITNFTWKLFNIRNYLRTINPRNSTFKFKPVTVNQVLKVLKLTKTSKAAGIDTIPGRIIKDISNELATPVMFLINKSLESGTFPTYEKTAKITPLHKSGDRSNIDNYRPISVLNVLSKVIERIVYEQLVDYLESRDLFSDYQFGFRRKKLLNWLMI
jgi:hypothetical protein